MRRLILAVSLLAAMAPEAFSQAHGSDGECVRVCPAGDKEWNLPDGLSACDTLQCQGKDFIVFSSVNKEAAPIPQVRSFVAGNKIYVLRIKDKIIHTQVFEIENGKVKTEVL